MVLAADGRQQTTERARYVFSDLLALLGSIFAPFPLDNVWGVLYAILNTILVAGAAVFGFFFTDAA